MSEVAAVANTTVSAALTSNTDASTPTSKPYIQPMDAQRRQRSERAGAAADELRAIYPVQNARRPRVHRWDARAEHSPLSFERCNRDAPRCTTPTRNGAKWSPLTQPRMRLDVSAPAFSSLSPLGLIVVVAIQPPWVFTTLTRLSTANEGIQKRAVVGRELALGQEGIHALGDELNIRELRHALRIEL